MNRTEQSLRALDRLYRSALDKKKQIHYHQSRLKRIHGWTPGEVREEIRKKLTKKEN